MQRNGRQPEEEITSTIVEKFKALDGPSRRRVLEEMQQTGRPGFIRELVGRGYSRRELGNTDTLKLASMAANR